MRSLKYRLFNVIAILVISSLFFLSNFTLLSLAQEPSPFEISVVPQRDHAVTGQPFTYTVTITNVSQNSLGTVFVNVDVPEGTKFIRTHHLSQNWYGGSPDADPNIQVEQLTLFSFEAIEPGQVFSFEMIVEVLGETKKEIALETFDSTNFEGDILAAGSSISTEVQTPTPTPSPSPSATATALAVADKVSQATPTSSINSPQTITRSNSSTQTETNSSLAVAIIAGAGLLLILALVGIVWLSKKR